MPHLWVMRYSPYILALALSVTTATETGETSDAELRVAELPAAVLADCPSVAGIVDRMADCTADFQSRWLARTPRGELFLVSQRSCVAEQCRSWLVVRDRRGVALPLLAVSGELRFDYSKGRFPAVQARAEISERYTSYERHEWRGGEYVRTETRLLHRVDDLECEDADSCDAIAREALQADQTERAVRIWEQVHGVNWI